MKRYNLQLLAFQETKLKGNDISECDIDAYFLIVDEKQIIGNWLLI